MKLQEILATIHRNQQQIDLLVANNTQLSNYLLQQGMIENMSQLPGGLPGSVYFNGHKALTAPALLADSVLLTEPQRKRGRPPGKANKKQSEFPPSNAARGVLYQEVMMKWAKNHNGTLDLYEFAKGTRGKLQGVTDAFFKTTMYTKAREMTKLGLLRKTDPGKYVLEPVSS